MGRSEALAAVRALRALGALGALGALLLCGRPSAALAAELAPPAEPTDEEAVAAWSRNLSTDRAEPARVGPPRDPVLAADDTHLGFVELVPSGDGFGLRLGHDWLGGDDFLRLEPELHGAFGPAAWGLSLPLRLRTLEGGLLDGGGLHLRSGEWSGARELLRPIRTLSYGARGEPVFASASQLHPVTLGRGTIVRRYLEGSGSRKGVLGGELELEHRFGRLHAMVGDVARGGMLGFLAAARPLAWLDGAAAGPTLGRTAVSLTYATDRSAPVQLVRAGAGFALDEEGDPVVASRPADLFGVSLETTLVQGERLELAPYLDLSRLAGGGQGWTAGLEARASPGEGERPALHGRLELRLFDGDYLPHYFDSFYPVDKFQLRSAGGSNDAPTKLQAVLAGDRASKLLGWSAEVSYRHPIGATILLGYEDAGRLQGPPLAPAGRGTLTLHGEWEGSSRLRLQLTAGRRDLALPWADDLFVAFAGRYQLGARLAIGGRLRHGPLLRGYEPAPPPGSGTAAAGSFSASTSGALELEVALDGCFLAPPHP